MPQVGLHPFLYFCESVRNSHCTLSLWQAALKDDEITQQFTILREGILQDVFSQRAFSAWQGAQPQRITVSLLLPGSSTAAQWREFLQSKRQFWPALTRVMLLWPHYVLMPYNASVAKCNQSTFGTLSIFAGMSWPGNSKCLLPLVSLVSSCGVTYLFSSIGRIHSRKGNTKAWISRRWTLPCTWWESCKVCFLP